MDASRALSASKRSLPHYTKYCCGGRLDNIAVIGTASNSVYYYTCNETLISRLHGLWSRNILHYMRWCCLVQLASAYWPPRLDSSKLHAHDANHM